jgi:hypothetical protein
MKTIFYNISIIIFLSILISSCKKEEGNNSADPDAKQHNEDISNIKSESDNLNTDINQILNEVKGFGKTGTINAITVCGANIDSSQQYSTPTIYINFDGTTTCPNPARIRSGQIKVELISGVKWTDAGAKLLVTHTNYKVQFPTLNNHYLIFNGTKTITNVNGINWITLYFGTSMATLRERSYDMQVTFENGQTSLWKSARLSTFGVRNTSEIYVTVNGDTTINGKTIDSWGVTRFGTNFTTEMLEPWKSSTSCGWWKPTEGTYTSVTDNFSITAKFGVDQNGNRVTSGCPYGLRLEWEITGTNTSGDIVLRYL